jgi:hypothetical protein
VPAAGDPEEITPRRLFGGDMTGISPTQSRDLPDVSRFLLRTYQADASSNLADIALLEWKYLSPRAGWAGSRGFVLDKAGRIAAHGGVCPAYFQLRSGDTVSTLTITDWAADRAFPGAGVALFSRLMKMADTAFVIGGSPATRCILPRIRFQQVGEASSFARWIRPWREFRTRQVTSRSVLRLAHGLAHALTQNAPVHQFQVKPVLRFDASLEPLFGSGIISATSIRRTVDDLNYLLQCPAALVKGYYLLDGASLRGYCILGRVSWEARLLDIFVNSAKLEDWRCAYAAATSVAANDPVVCRIRALATAPLHREALRQNGYWKQLEEPIMIHDPRRLLLDAFPANFQLFDGDAGY